MKKYLIEIIIIISIILMIVMLGKIYEQTKPKDLEYHEVADCIEINEDIFCRIAPVVDY